jgi:RNA:NAD 2'-phosphotransferase (TPT1/KptA family)
MLDPLKQQPIQVPATIYHVSSLQNKDRILKKGLIPSKGSRYNKDFMYPPRVHVFLDRDFDALKALAIRIFNYGRSTKNVYRAGHDDFPVVIFGIETDKLRPGTKFYEDASVENGAWTYTHIPPEALYVAYEDEDEEEDNADYSKYGKGW